MAPMNHPAEDTASKRLHLEAADWSREEVEEEVAIQLRYSRRLQRNLTQHNHIWATLTGTE